MHDGGNSLRHAVSKIINLSFMKKFNSMKIKSIALLAFAFMANIAVGQNLKVTSNGNPVANNDVIEVAWEFEDLSLPEYEMYYYMYTWNPRLEVSTVEGSESVSVTVESIDNATDFQICWPVNCLFITSGGSVTVNGNAGTTPSDLKVHKEVSFENEEEKPTEGGSVKVTVEGASDVIEFTVKCLLEDAGVGGNLVEGNYAPEYYTLQGVRVAEPQKGQLVIERKGSKTAKRIF